MMLPIFSPMLPNAINHLLGQESWARAQLLPHANKVACLDAGVATVRLKVTADGMVASALADEPVAVTIRVRPADLPLILQNRERAFSYVKIDGDADFANTISKVSQNLRWDIANDLSQVVGDIAAQRIVDGAGAAATTVRSTQKKVMENLAEYFLEEQPMLMRPQAVTDFTADVTRLRDDVERLAKRIERIERPA